MVKNAQMERKFTTLKKFGHQGQACLALGFFVKATSSKPLHIYYSIMVNVFKNLLIQICNLFNSNFCFHGDSSHAHVYKQSFFFFLFSDVAVPRRKNG